MARIYLVISILLCFLGGYSQDIHFSQYKMSPVLVNPAQAGFCFAKARITANHRSQWRAVTVPFNTFSMSGDFKIYQDRRSENIFGAGLSAYYDNAGDSKFGTTSAAMSLAYIRALNDYHNHYLSIGAAGSFNDRSYDYAQLMFGNQFDGKQFDPDRFSGETFLNRGFTYYDFNAGIHWYYRADQENAYDAGIVLSHINKPPQSMMGNPDILLDRKLTLYVNAELLRPNKRTLMPGFYFTRQGTYTEIIAGSMVSLDWFATGYALSELYAGLFIRPVDAAIVMVSFEYHNITFGISYDINYSGLRAASTFRGGFELSALYMFHKKKSTKTRNIPCPDPF